MKAAEHEVLRQRLDEGLLAMGGELDEEARTRLVAYVDLLHRWNKAFNLTAVRDPLQMVPRHLLDSLSILGFLGPGRVADIGAGAGLPGIPLAIARPHQPFVLIDSNGKKSRFLIQAAAELGLDNVDVIHSRAETYRPELLFDTVTARAVGSLSELIKVSRHLLLPGGRLLAMKGEYPAAELGSLPSDCSIKDIVRLEVPGVEGVRHLVCVEVGSHTNE